MAENDTKSTDKVTAPDDIAEMVHTNGGAYSEDNELHRPAPLYQYGTLDTSDTGGTVNNSIVEVSPVFAEARAQNLKTAARALDPDDDGVSADLVILPESSVTVTGAARTPEDAKAELQAAINRMTENPVEVGGQTPGQQEAAEEHDVDRTERNEDDRDNDSRRQSQEAGNLAGPETHPTPDSPSRRGARNSTSSKS